MHPFGPPPSPNSLDLAVPRRTTHTCCFPPTACGGTQNIRNLEKGVLEKGYLHKIV